MSRYFGVALLGFGLWAWVLRDARDIVLVEALLVAHGISDVAGILVSIWALATGSINQLGWLNVLLYATLLAFCLYIYRTMSKVTARLSV